LSSLTSEELRELFRYLVLSRGLEERLEHLLKQGQVVGDLYDGRGQEAAVVGSAFALEEGDWLAPSLREMGALLHHLTIPHLGLLGPIGPLGAHLCVLNGVALAFRMRGERRVCLTYLGDGASRTGAAHEGLNLAAVQRLPLVVILIHNRWAFGTRSDQQAAVADWIDVAAAYGVPAASVDGNDVLQVYDETRRAVDRARRGEGVTLIVAETYRMQGHAQHDSQEYVPAEELHEWRARDPIDLFERYLIDSGFESRPSLAVVKEAVRRELAAAAEEALSAPMPEPEGARFRTVEGEDIPVPWTRREAVYEDVGQPAMRP
jgi:pyruvate dehydrogenase E1 component alpha subunit/2-oxoisovalerate dehydrogenase E1 component alpha subunit